MTDAPIISAILWFERSPKIEKTTDHDVKAAEYFIKGKLKKNKFFVIPSAARNLRRMSALNPASAGDSSGKALRMTGGGIEFIHFALTSEDVNNIAYSLMWQEGVKMYINHLNKLINLIKGAARSSKNQPMLSLTHGQPASPTTLGKELAVFCFRLKKQMTELERIQLTGKFSGAVGNWHAHAIAYPQMNWMNFSERFISSLGLTFNPLTTQIESHDTLAQSLDALKRINTILINLCQDMWLYISRDVFHQLVKKGEVGSSTMPHKVNPIKFENAESNASLAISMLEHMSRTLPVSRMQRDLRDSTLIRNQGVALGHSLLAVKSAAAGLSRVTPNKEHLKKELDEHWEVLAEPIQTVLRKVGCLKPYEKLKELTRGKTVTKESVQKFISGLDIPKEEKRKLLKLTPQNYTGLAAKLVGKYFD